MRSVSFRRYLVAATVLSSQFVATQALADCVSQAPVHPEQVVCDSPGTLGWNGTSTNAIVVTVNAGSTVDTSAGGSALISTGTGSAVINFAGNFNNGAPTFGIDAGSPAATAISVGGGSIITNTSGATINGSIVYGNATGSNVNILNNNYSSGGGASDIEGNITAQGNFTFNNQGFFNFLGWGDITQTGAGTVTINNGVAGGFASPQGGINDSVIWATSLSTFGHTAINNLAGATIYSQSAINIGQSGGGTSTVNNAGTIGADLTMSDGTNVLTNSAGAAINVGFGSGSVVMGGQTNTVTNDGSIVGDVTMNGTTSNTFNAGSAGSAGDNGLRLPGSGVVGTLTGLGSNAAHNTLNLNGTGTSTLQNGIDIRGWGTVNKNDSGTWIIKATLDDDAGKLTTVNLNAGILSVDDASFLGSSATTVHNFEPLGNVDSLVFNGTAAGTFAGNIDGTGQVEFTGPNATTLTGTVTITGNTFINGGTLNANSTGALSSTSNLYMGNGTLNVNANVTTRTLYDYFGTNVINIAGGDSLNVAGGSFGNNGGVINGLGSLIKYSTGTLDLSGADQINPGSLIVNNGTVNDNGGALGSSVAVQVNSTATTTGVLNVNASDTIGSLAGTGANATVNLTGGAVLDTGGLNTTTAYAGHIAGAGSLVKNGTGLLTLTGANTYTGGTTVNDGAIIGFVGTGASITGNYTLNNGAFLTFNQLLNPGAPHSGTYAGDVTGGPSAYMQFGGNSSTLVTLTGNNTGFAGTSTFGFGNSTIGQGGTVAIGSANNIGTGNLQFYDGVLRTTADITLGNTVSLQTTGGGGTFNTDAGTTLTLTGPITGGGALLKTGTGRLVLSGGLGNTFTGVTTVSAGVLQTDAFSIWTGNIVNNAAVEMTGCASPASCISYNYANISGTGSLRVINSTGLALGGTNTYSGNTYVDAGSILHSFSAGAFSSNSNFVVNGGLVLNSSQTIGALSGTGTVSTGANTLTIGATNASGDFAGVFGPLISFSASSANVNKIGTGTQTLSGTGSALTGNLGINAGTLSLTGTLTSATTNVASGATLYVDGTLTSPTVTIASGGWLRGGVGTAPGHINGAVTNSGTVAPGHSPGILAIGGSYTQTATGTYAADVYGNGTNTVVAGTDFDRIAVTGAPGTATLAGTLAVTQNGGIYVAGTTYDIITTTGGITGNFTAVTGTGNSTFLSLSNAAANGGGVQGNNYRLVVVRAAYNTAATNPNQVAVANGLTGIIGSTGAAATVNKIDNMTAAQAQALFTTASPEPYGAYATALQDQGELFTRQVAHRQAEGRIGEGKTGLWANFYGNWGNGKDRGDYRLGNDHSITGGAVGIDFSAGALRAGVAGGYSEDKVTYLGGNSSGKSKSWQAGGYISYAMDDLHVDGQLAYVSGDITATKAVAAGSGATLISGTAGADTSGHVFKGVLTLGYDMGGEKFTFEPYVGIDFTSGKVNGFTETGMAALDLTVADIKADRTDLVVGARLAAPMGAISPYLNAAYRYDLSDHPGTVTAFFNGVSAAPFTVSTIGSGRSVVEVDAGLSARIGSSASLFVGYQGSFRNDMDSHGVNGGVRLNF